MSEYLFDQAWRHEHRRLDALGALYDAGSLERLRRVGLQPGWRCLEVGAGSGTVARAMAAAVTPGGSVVATDLDPRFLEMIAGDGIEVRRHDVARDPLEERAFDLVHARAVLQHVPARDAALAKLARAVRSGGHLVIEDIVMPHPSARPDLPGWARLLRGMELGLKAAGADPYYGLALPGALAAQGLRDVGCDARVELMHSGTPSIDFVTLSLEQVGDQLVTAGLATSADLTDTLAAFRVPGYTLTGAIMVTAWGTAP